jgi:hypothetical protein
LAISHQEYCPGLALVHSWTVCRRLAFDPTGRLMAGTRSLSRVSVSRVPTVVVAFATNTALRSMDKG